MQDTLTFTSCRLIYLKKQSDALQYLMLSCLFWNLCSGFGAFKGVFAVENEVRIQTPRFAVWPYCILWGHSIVKNVQKNTWGGFTVMPKKGTLLRTRISCLPWRVPGEQHGSASLRQRIQVSPTSKTIQNLVKPHPRGVKQKPSAQDEELLQVTLWRRGPSWQPSRLDCPRLSFMFFFEYLLVCWMFRKELCSCKSIGCFQLCQFRVIQSLIDAFSGWFFTPEIHIAERTALATRSELPSQRRRGHWSLGRS